MRLTRSFLLCLALTSSCAFAQGNSASSPKFDVISIRPSDPNEQGYVSWRLPDAFIARNTPLVISVALAFFPPHEAMYKATANRILGAPSWLTKERYDVVAKVAPEDLPAWQKQGTRDEMLHAMLQTALVERCKLVVRYMKVEAPVYALVVAKRAPAIKETPSDEPPPTDGVPLIEGGMMVGYKHGSAPVVHIFATSMAAFAAELSQSSDRLVLDKTGIAGKYDFALSLRDTGGGTSSEPAPSSIWDLEELGFKLVPTKAPVDTIIIHHIEKPSEN